MGSRARTIQAGVSAIAAALALTACTASAETARSINEVALAEASAAADCGTTSITLDHRAAYQSSIAVFLERARTSGCDYGAIEIANAPGAKTDGHAGAVAVARDFVDAFGLSWRIQPAGRDASLPASSVRVTLLAPRDADRWFAAAQAVAG